jgi:hypothetical protein
MEIKGENVGIDLHWLGHKVFSYILGSGLPLHSAYKKAQEPKFVVGQ